MLSTVLIIDPRKELSVKYKKSIESADIDCIIARKLKDALVMVQSIEPDMILISDTIEEELSCFCNKIRALTFDTRPIIVALSKSADYKDKIKVLENGADDFISEPVNIEEFKTRIKAHLRRDIELNLDSNTLLPNKKFVRKILKRVLSTNTQAVLLVGFENLKNYKAVYSQLASDKIIQTFVAIAKSALSDNDFIGQNDDENFIIVTNAYYVDKLASFLTFAFDTVAPKFYSDKDSKRGYMLMKNERLAGMRANFVSILVGGIVEGFNLISSVNLLLERLFEVKALAKIPNGSNYMIERARLTAPDSVKILENNGICIKEKDNSLRYLIRTALELQGYDVNEDIDSGSCPSIIILDISEDEKEIEILKNLRNEKNLINTKIIVTTTVYDKSSILSAGADLYLPKPYEITDLIKWVEYFMKIK